MRFHRCALATSFLLVVACGGDDVGETNDGGTTAGAETTAGSDAADGTTGSAGATPEYFDGELSASLGSASNQARCSTCHSTDGTREGFSGASMQDIAFKDDYKGGDAPDLLAATNACVVGWMGGEALAASDPAYLALAEFFESISDPTATTPNPLMPEVLADEAAYELAYAGGDAVAGAAKYDTFCAVCHDSALVVNSSPAYPKGSLGSFTVGRIAQQVRTSGPPPSGTSDATDTTVSPMPFFEPEELAASDLADIIAHLQGA